MRKDYLYSGVSRNYLDTGPLKNNEGGMNLDRLFTDHRDLIVGANAGNLMGELLKHVRERWSRDNYEMTGILWARKGPMSGENLGTVRPMGLDLHDDELRSVVTISLRMGGRALIEKLPGMKEVFKHIEGAKNAEVLAVRGLESFQDGLAHDALMAFASSELMIQAADRTDAIGATVIGPSAMVDTEKGVLTPGLLVFHEHIATGPQKFWCPATGLKDGVMQGLCAWEPVTTADVHPIMRRFANMLPVRSYGVGGEA